MSESIASSSLSEASECSSGTTLCAVRSISQTLAPPLRLARPVFHAYVAQVLEVHCSLRLRNPENASDARKRKIRGEVIGKHRAGKRSFCKGCLLMQDAPAMPDEFLCPISLQPMSAPVKCLQTQMVYDRASFHAWLAQGKLSELSLST